MSRALAVLACALAAAAAAPAPAPLTLDQRQEGELNVRADLHNLVLLAVLPARAPSALDLLSALKTSRRGGGGGGGGERRAGGDHDLLEAFAEPGTPYRVEIASALRAEDGPAPLVLPVLADRYVPGAAGAAGAAARRGPAAEDAEELLVLVGAQEQCGPGRARDREGVCAAVPPAPAPAPAAQADPSPAPVTLDANIDAVQVY